MGKRVAILGGGILGMTLALRLAKEDQEVTLFEANEKLGGLANAWEIHGFTWDRFYHVILLSDSYTRWLLKEIGLENEIQWVETKTGFFTDGNLYSMSNSIEFLKFPPLGLIDKIRLAITIFVASKITNWKKLESVPVTDWLKKWSGEKTFNKIWLPLLRAKLGEHYKETSAAFIWATIQRMYAARRSGLKKEMFGYVKSGYANIMKKLENKLRALGVEIRTGEQVAGISSGGDGIIIKLANSSEFHFDYAISTLPLGISSNICKGLNSDEYAKLNNITYLGVICASLVLKRPLSNYYVTNITDPGIPFTGIIEMSALVDKTYFNGNSLIYLPKYVHPDDLLFRSSDEEIENLFIASLTKMYPLADEDILSIKIARAKNVFALSSLSYSANLPKIRTSIPGVFILNSAHITNGTLNVNETIKLTFDKLQTIMSNTNGE